MKTSNQRKLNLIPPVLFKLTGSTTKAMTTPAATSTAAKATTEAAKQPSE